MNFLERLDMTCPIIQAPMAGVSTPALAAAVSNAGGLGSIGIGATDADGARPLIEDLKKRTLQPFNVNLFVHSPARHAPEREAQWLAALEPLFTAFASKPPQSLREIYRSFANDDDLLSMLVDLAPPVVSFHFGLPPSDRIAALKRAGCMLISTATNLSEARAAEAAGMDVVVAQGYEAGGHRGMFDPAAPDDCLGTLPLTRLLAERAGLPVIASGGIMDGQGIAAALNLGAVAVQLGTAFVGCPESDADQAYRRALKGDGAFHTVMTDAISGRPARCLGNRFTEWARYQSGTGRPDYPIAYDAGKALNKAAKTVGEEGYGAQWAGQGAPLHRPMPAADLMALLESELAACRCAASAEVHPD